MRTFLLLFALLSAGLLGAGCSDDAIHDCNTDPQEGAIDPSTGKCTIVSDADGCSLCFMPCLVGTIDHFNYAPCLSSCSSAFEAECLKLPECRAAYTDNRFFACLPTAPKSVLHDGRCDRLDAYVCSLHDNCTVHYTAHLDGTRSFHHCADENP